MTATNSDGRALKRARKQFLSNESMGKKQSPSNMKEDTGGQVVSTREKEDISIYESKKVLILILFLLNFSSLKWLKTYHKVSDIVDLSRWVRNR